MSTLIYGWLQMEGMWIVKTSRSPRRGESSGGRALLAALTLLLVGMLGPRSPWNPRTRGQGAPPIVAPAGDPAAYAIPGIEPTVRRYQVKGFAL